MKRSSDIRYFSNTTNQPRAAIVYLVRSKAQDIINLKRSLHLLDTNFNIRHKYPIILFHEDLDERTIKDLFQSTKSPIRFEKLKFKIPSFLPRNEVPEFVYAKNTKFGIGYRHMCRFFAGGIYKEPAFEALDYYWRLDTDSFIPKKINYDVFRLMEEKNYIYGYISIMKDLEEVVEGLWHTTNKYIKENNIKPTFLHKFIKDGAWDRSNYYTNFEISRTDFWRSKQVTDYFDYLDHSGGIYKHRWGDHVIHLLTLSMFAPESQVHRFSDVPYQHQEFANDYNLLMKARAELRKTAKRIMRRG